MGSRCADAGQRRWCPVSRINHHGDSQYLLIGPGTERTSHCKAQLRVRLRNHNISRLRPDGRLKFNKCTAPRGRAAGSDPRLPNALPQTSASAREGGLQGLSSQMRLEHGTQQGRRVTLSLLWHALGGNAGRDRHIEGRRRRELCGRTSLLVRCVRSRLEA